MTLLLNGTLCCAALYNRLTTNSMLATASMERSMAHQHSSAEVARCFGCFSGELSSDPSLYKDIVTVLFSLVTECRMYSQYKRKYRFHNLVQSPPIQQHRWSRRSATTIWTMRTCVRVCWPATWPCRSAAARWELAGGTTVICIPVLSTALVSHTKMFIFAVKLDFLSWRSYPTLQPQVFAFHRLRVGANITSDTYYDRSRTNCLYTLSSDCLPPFRPLQTDVSVWKRFCSRLAEWNNHLWQLRR